MLIRYFPLLFYFLRLLSLPESQVQAEISCPEFATPEEALAYLRDDRSKDGIADDLLVNVLLGCKNQFNFTIKQLTEFVQHRRNTFHRILAREVPLCVLAGGSPKLSRFKNALEAFDQEDEKHRNGEKSKYYPLPKVWSSGSGDFWLDTIEFRKIETPDASYDKVLHQWISVKFHFSRQVTGIIVQPIEGFLGIPFGEFRIDFSCFNDPASLNLTDIRHFPDVNVIPCRYRPRTSLVHPHILVFGGDESRETNPVETYTDIVFHFNWINAPCHDVAAFQFLVILLAGDNNQKQTFVTPVYEVKVPSSYDGIPTHFYPDPRRQWTDKIICTPDSQPPPKNPTCLDLEKDCRDGDAECLLELLSPCNGSVIPYSRTYDNCITGKSGPPKDGETCPPGPFFCSKFPSTKTSKEWEQERQENLHLLRQCGEHMPRQTETGVKCEINAQPSEFWEHVKPTPVLPVISTPGQVGRRRRRRSADQRDPSSGDLEREYYYRDTNVAIQRPARSDENMEEELEHDETETTTIPTNDTTDSDDSDTTTDSGDSDTTTDSGDSDTTTDSGDSDTTTDSDDSDTTTDSGDSDTTTDSDDSDTTTDSDDSDTTTDSDDSDITTDSDDSDITTDSDTTADSNTTNEVNTTLEPEGPEVVTVQYSTTTTTTESPNHNSDLNEYEIFVKELQKLGLQHYKFNKRLHGLLMILAFLVINPLSTYIARYFKETASVCCWGIPCWMMVHIILSILSITMIWLGIVASLGNAGQGVVDCDLLLDDGPLNTLCTDHQNSAVHMFIGAVTVAAFHMSAASAWSRPKESRGMYMTTHSFSGYFTFIGASMAASAMLVNRGVCIEIKFEAAVLFLLILIMWSIECCVQMIQDRRLHLKGRHFFPMLEGMKIHETLPACHCMKVFVFLIAIMAHLTGGAMVVMSYIVLNNEDLYVDRNSTEDTYRVPGLLFDSCEILNYIVVIAKTEKEV